MVQIPRAADEGMLEGYLARNAAIDNEYVKLLLKRKKLRDESLADGLDPIAFCWIQRLLKMKPEQRENVLIAFDLYREDLKLDAPDPRPAVRPLPYDVERVMAL